MDEPISVLIKATWLEDEKDKCASITIQDNGNGFSAEAQEPGCRFSQPCFQSFCLSR